MAFRRGAVVLQKSREAEAKQVDGFVIVHSMILLKKSFPWRLKLNARSTSLRRLARIEAGE